MKDKRYYAIKNIYGTSTSAGFGNTWEVLVFKSKKERDKYVDQYSIDNISVQSIKRSEVGKYLNDDYKPFDGKKICVDWRNYYDREPFGIVTREWSAEVDYCGYLEAI